MRKIKRGTQADPETRPPVNSDGRNGDAATVAIADRGTSLHSPLSTCEKQYQPAFFDTRTNTVHISRYPDGRPAPIHLPDNLPDDLQRESGEHTSSVTESVVVGFLRGQTFYTRQQVSRRLAHDGQAQRIEKQLTFW